MNKKGNEMWENIASFIGIIVGLAFAIWFTFGLPWLWPF
jgi:hypothetical protein